MAFSASILIAKTCSVVPRPGWYAAWSGGMCCFRPCSHGYDIVPFHFGPFQKVVRRGVAFTRVRKKSSGPFQNRSRNWAVRKSEPEIGTIRYRTVPFSCEQKRYDIVPLSGPVWYIRVTPSWFLMMSRLRLDLIAPH